MAWQKRFFEKNKPVHVVSRAVVDIFKNKEDCYRFIFQFYVASLGKRGFNVSTKDAIKAGQALLYEEKIPPRFVVKEHPPLIHLLDFSLVVNHNHFYLLPNSENAIPIFMQKLNNGFAQSFNLLHKRKDAVFGSRYRSVLVENEFQSHAVSRYVSIMNPLDVFQPGWRETGLRNSKEALKFLEDYEFSSFPDKIRKRKSQILAPQEVLEQYTSFWGSENEYQEFVEGFLKERSISSYPTFIE